MRGFKAGGTNTQPGLPVPWPLEADREDLGQPRLDTAPGKALLLEAKGRALTEEVFVEANMLVAPDSFERLLTMVTGAAPASLFRLVNVDMGWVEAMGTLVDTVAKMQALFDAFRVGNSATQVKVIFCLKRLWETRVFELFLAQILERCANDVTSLMDLYHVAVILSFEVPNSGNYAADIFPYGSTASTWVQTHCSASVEAFVRSVMCSYYIRIIHNIFMMNSVSNMHHIKPILSKYNQLHQARVCEVEGGTAALYNNTVFPLLCNARSGACALGVFLVVQIISTKNPKLEAFARQHDFVTPLRDVASLLRYSHSKWACSHLMKMLLTAPNLLDHALPCYRHWYVDATSSEHYDLRHVRFRFAYEFAHSVLRDGIERGTDPAKSPTLVATPAGQWASPLRHSVALGAIVDALSDVTHPERALRAVSMLKLLVSDKWTKRKDWLDFCSLPREGAMPSKAAPLAGGSSDRLLSVSGTTRLTKTASFFKKKSLTSRKLNVSACDRQLDSDLLSLEEKMLLRVCQHLPIADLLVMCTVCWRLTVFINNPAHDLWRAAFQRESANNSMRSLKLKGDDPKQHCKALCRSALPNALYRLVFISVATPGAASHTHAAAVLSAADQTPEQQTRKEVVKTALSLVGKLQRQPLWWSDVDPYVESHWLVLLLQMVHDGSSLEMNRSAWRLFYQLLAYHAGMIDRLIEGKYLDHFLRPLDVKSAPVVVFNGMYYLAKLLANEPPTAEFRKRMARKDVQTLAQWIRDAGVWSQWHAIYSAFQADPRTSAFVFPSVAALFVAVHDSFLCKKLKSAVFKTPEYRAAIVAVRDLSHGKGAEDAAAARQAAAAEAPPLSPMKHDDMAPLKGSLGRKRSAPPTTAPLTARAVTASGVKVQRDIGRLGKRLVDVSEGSSLIRRNSDPDLDAIFSSSPAKPT